jgi:hypothetical protein
MAGSAEVSPEMRDIGDVRVRPDILRGARESYNSAQHEPDHRKNDKTDVVAGEVLVVFSEASATTEPAVGPLRS